MNWDISGLLFGFKKTLLHWTDDAEFYFLLVKIYWWSAMHVTGASRNQYMTTQNTKGGNYVCTCTSARINRNLMSLISWISYAYYLNISDKRKNQRHKP